jgi:hypothetical protein
MDNQVQLLLEDPKFADVSNPKYAQIRESDFPSLLHKAIRLEVADRIGDWEPVPEIDISNGRDEIAKSSTTSTVDEAIKKMAEMQGKPEPDLPDPKEAMLESFQEDTEKIISDIEEESEALAPEEPDTSDTPEEPDTPEPPRPNAVRMNTNPAAGIMIGGGSGSSAPQYKKPKDPWEVNPNEVKVEPGAKIRMGLNKMDKGKKE